MKALKYLVIVLGGFLLFVGCQKETSFENGLPLESATGSLKDTSGNCMTITPNGKYIKNAVLTDSNYVVVNVNFSTPGSYSISTDTSNGFSFQGSGIVADSGLQSIILKGTGTPVSLQMTNFAVTFDTSVCMFSINVSDSALVTPVTSADYFPTTDSSNWTYEVNSQPDDSINTAVAGTDQTISLKTYRTFIVNQDGETDTAFYRKEEGSYYEYSDLNNYSLYDTVNSKAEYAFLKDNVPVSTTWESPEVDATFNTVAGKAKIKFTIEGKDIQTTIGNTTIDSVIQVKREYMFSPSVTAGTYATIITGQFYYAKNIGFIKAETSDPLPLTINVRHWEVYY